MNFLKLFMRIIKLKTTDYDLQDLIEYFTGKIKVLEGKNFYKLEIKDEKIFEIVAEKIAIFLSCTKYLEILEKALSKKIKSQEDLDEILEIHSEMLMENFYFTYITKILLINYLKDHDELNIDAFMMFNMSEMDAEIKRIASIEIESYVPNKIPNGKREKEQPARKENIIDRLIAIHDERYIDNLFKDIHIKYINNKLVFENDSNETLSIDYIQETLDVLIKIEQNPSQPINPEIFLLNLLTIVYKVKRIIIHNNIPDSIQREIEFNMIKLIESGANLKIYFADGAKPLL